MRTTFVISFALAAAFASSTAFAAGDTPAKPVQNFIRILPPAEPAASVPVTPVKLQTPATRQIVPEAAAPQPAPQANFVPAPAPTPPVAKLTGTDAPEVTGDLQAETPDAATPPAPTVEQPAPPAAIEKPADAQALIQGDAAPAPKAEVQAAPAPGPVEPAPAAAPVPVKKVVRVYAQEEPAYDGYAGQDYGYNDGCE